MALSLQELTQFNGRRSNGFAPSTPPFSRFELGLEPKPAAAPFLRWPQSLTRMSPVTLAPGVGALGLKCAPGHALVERRPGPFGSYCKGLGIATPCAPGLAWPSGPNVCARPFGPVPGLRGGFGGRLAKVDIAEGAKGTEQTLYKMKDAVLGDEGAHNQEVRLLAQKIVSGVGNKDYRGEGQAIFDFMKRYVRYTLDPRGLEWVQTPWWTLLLIGQGDCDDHATAICALATALGHGCAFRTVKGDRDRPDEWSHVYAVIGIREKGQAVWLAADSTEKNAVFGRDPPGAAPLPMRTWVVVPA